VLMAGGVTMPEGSLDALAIELNLGAPEGIAGSFRVTGLASPSATVGSATLAITAPQSATNAIPERVGFKLSLVEVRAANVAVESVGLSGSLARAVTSPETDENWAYWAKLAPYEADFSGLAKGITGEKGLAIREVSLAGALAVDALRIAAWRPSWSREVDERSLPHEVDWLRTAVHLTKGCYRGQETVAKVHNLGHPPRRLMAVHLDGADSILPPPGSKVHIASGEVGVLTSVALHVDDGPIGLALVRRTTPDGDATVQTAEGAVAARLETIVPPEAGAAASVPRLPRLSRRAAASPPSP